ncbi:hypothetical protein GJAV_G00112110 [Gymnothorax javanicus]|nr:hypothetical protein GJAV_G00112110 [Gymnothorax javanicus]
MQLLLGLILTLTFSISTGEVKVLTMAEGEKVSMDCTFRTSSGADYYFYWYRQYPGGQTTVARRMQGWANEVDEGGQRQNWWINLTGEGEDDGEGRGEAGLR